jgi:hypothetical protein
VREVRGRRSDEASLTGHRLFACRCDTYHRRRATAQARRLLKGMSATTTKLGRTEGSASGPRCLPTGLPRAMSSHSRYSAAFIMITSGLRERLNSRGSDK